MSQLKSKRTGTANGSESSSVSQNEWTLMFYHSGDSDLGEEFIWAMKEMARIGVQPGIEVVALMDSVAPTPFEFLLTSPWNRGKAANKNGNGKLTVNSEADPEERNLFDPESGYLVRYANQGHGTGNGRPIGKEASLKEKRPGQVDFASAKLLRNFIESSIKNHPARHYLLILSGHASGMIGKTFLLDRGAGRFMSIPRLAWALQDAIKRAIKKGFKVEGEDPRIDVLGLDACGMMTAEVCNLLRTRVKYMVASQGFMTLAGWPYHRILQYLNAHPDAEPKEVADQLVTRTIRYYSDFARVGTSVDLAACRLDHEPWENLTASIRALTERLSAKTTRERRIDDDKVDAKANMLVRRQVSAAVIAAHWYCQSYANEQYVDLYDFCEILKDVAPEFATECDEILQHMSDVVVRQCYAGSGFQRSHGISLFFPWAATLAELVRYSFRRDRRFTPFNEKTGWGDFLIDFIHRTRRLPRPPHGRMTSDEILLPPEGFFDHIGESEAREPEAARSGTIANVRDGVGPNIRSGVPANVRTGVPSNIRIGFPPGFDFDPPRGHRSGVPPNVRSGTIANIRGNLVIPKVKNPALSYFEDRCTDEVPYPGSAGNGAGPVKSRKKKSAPKS